MIQGGIAGLQGLFRQHLSAGWHRLQQTFVSIIQCGIAAGLAYLVVEDLLGHDSPFFAPMASIIVLSANVQGRTRRSIELLIGVAIGVGAGDVFVRTFGTGIWQMIIMVWLALLLATMIDRSPLVYTQAALGAVLIATILPPGSGGGAERMFDAFIGGLVGIVVAGLMPSSPLKRARMEVSRVLELTAKVLEDVAEGLKTQQGELITDALKKARGSQAAINAMLLRAQEEQEQLNVSPFLWHHQRRLNSLQRILNPVDNAMRNTRVLARRAVLLAEDNDEVSPAQIRFIQELADITKDLSELYTTRGDLEESLIIPESTKSLRQIGRQLGEEVIQGRVLSAMVIFAQTRSITVDLLVICGMSRQSALACLMPTSKHPAVPSEIAHRAEHIREFTLLDADPDRPATQPMPAIDLFGEDEEEGDYYPPVGQFPAVTDATATNDPTASEQPALKQKKKRKTTPDGLLPPTNVHDAFDAIDNGKSRGK